MIGVLHSTNPVCASLAPSRDLVQLGEWASYARDQVRPVNARYSKPFCFSLNGSFSSRANDRRRMDLVVTRAEKSVLDSWIRTLDKMELWKTHTKKCSGADPSESLRGASYLNGQRTGQGAGKAIPERLDSSYSHQPDDPPDTEPPGEFASMMPPTHPHPHPHLLPEEQEEPDVVWSVWTTQSIYDEHSVRRTKRRLCSALIRSVSAALLLSLFASFFFFANCSCVVACVPTVTATVTTRSCSATVATSRSTRTATVCRKCPRASGTAARAAS